MSYNTGSKTIHTYIARYLSPHSHFTSLYNTVHALKKLTFYRRTTPTATGVLRSRLRAYDAYGYGRTWSKATGVLGLRLRAYYAYGYRRIAATTTGVLQAYYGLAAGCKLTSGHYNHER